MVLAVVFVQKQGTKLATARQIIAQNQSFHDVMGVKTLCRVHLFADVVGIKRITQPNRHLNTAKSHDFLAVGVFKHKQIALLTLFGIAFEGFFDAFKTA